MPRAIVAEVRRQTACLRARLGQVSESAERVSEPRPRGSRCDELRLAGFLFLCIPLTSLARIGPGTETSLGAAGTSARATGEPVAKRLLILKVDGLNADLLFNTMAQRNPATGKSRLPWFEEIFARNGLIFDNFYTRGISLSAPSWSMLDTGHHLVIKGNVEYDRYTGRVYDYLNFFPFYVGYARSHEVDMPSVRVLDEAGVPLLIDAFPYDRRYQSFQLFQRGVQWTTLREGLKHRLSTHVLLSLLEDPQGGLGLGEGLEKEIEDEVIEGLSGATVEYLDFFTGDVDHIGHSVNDPRILTDELVRLDALAGRLWNAVEAGPLAGQTLFAVVSDHGMNNVPAVYSQTFSLPDLLNSTAGGAHHVVTNRHQLQEYKIAGLDPRVFRVINPSTASFYLEGEANEYPTAWLDLDGNERAAVSFRNSELNRIHVVLKQLARPDLAQPVRSAAARYLTQLLGRRRATWESEIKTLDGELQALSGAIVERQAELSRQPKKWTAAERESGKDKEARRKASELNQWTEERSAYQNYIHHLQALLALKPSEREPLKEKITDLIPRLSLGDPNSLYDLRHYVAGPAGPGLALDASGNIDERNSFRYIDYFPLFAAQAVRNNPQEGISPHPLDFAAVALPPEDIPAHAAGGNRLSQAIWLYGDDGHQLLELAVRDGEALRIRLLPVAHLAADRENDSSHLSHLSWDTISWTQDLPLKLFEDENLKLPRNVDRRQWLSEWHTEREWFQAIHECRYSNGVIGVTEELLPPKIALPNQQNNGLLGKLEIERRDLVQPDLLLFAADHWNFNTRNFNPGGNHGGFLRISTHSVWMMSGARVPRGNHIAEPYDSLNFASTLLNLVGKPAPILERIVPVTR
jgi:Type I phosphodiesterase / nucleotide pyrophosphatase